jgi:hypothetical protein
MRSEEKRRDKPSWLPGKQSQSRAHKQKHAAVVSAVSVVCRFELLLRSLGVEQQPKLVTNPRLALVGPVTATQHPLLKTN